jgi:GMP synthase-like glutamine amidotransferase
MRLLVVQHEQDGPGGVLADRFGQRGFEVNVWLAPAAGSAKPDVSQYDALMVLGAQWSVYGSEQAGWVEPELEALRRADDLGVPVLGVCFGGQMLAQALGGSVARSPAPEMGWRSVVSADPEGPWFQWHFDRWTLSLGAEEVAANECGSQAFVLRKNMALQFHPEALSDIVAEWIRYGEKDVRSLGLDPDELLCITKARDEAATVRAHALVDAFVSRFVRDSEQD